MDEGWILVAEGVEALVLLRQRGLVLENIVFFLLMLDVVEVEKGTNGSHLRCEHAPKHLELR